AQFAFPDSNTLSPPALPATLLQRRPDIQSAWLRVLQQNASLAVAHKARFPSLSLSASAGKGAAELSDIPQSNLAWGIGASLIQPLINAGRLKSAEDIARLRLQQFEKSYLDTVNRAFQQVETALQSQVNLDARLNYTQASSSNAVQAEKLAFDQYQRGLVAYSTVLEAQRRSVDAQIQVISLKKQIIVNKITLLNAVGGELDFIPWPNRQAGGSGEGRMLKGRVINRRTLGESNE
nr:TolC family protein [Cellvibrionaceae bacterium]